jgi:PAS domain S-box-containing protein
MTDASKLGKKAEVGLKENKNLLNSIIRETTDTIFVKDLSGRYVMMNPAGANIIGKSIEEIIGKDDTQLFPHDIARKLIKEDQDIIASGKTIAFDEKIPKDGNIRIFHTLKVPYRSHTGNIIGVIGIARNITERKCLEKELKELNKSLEQRVTERTAELAKTNEELKKEITERKQTEEKLRKSEEKYRRLIEGLQDNFFFYSHNTEGIFTYISPSITNVLEYSPQEFLTHYSEYMTDNPSNKEVIQHTDLSIKGIKQPPYNVEIYHKNGSIRTLRVQEVPVFDSKGNVIAVEGIAEDITERKKMEEALLQSEKLKAIGIMTDGIAHEFNNVLAVIRGFAHLIKKRYGDHKEMEEHIGAINNAVADGTEIVRRMHEFAHARQDTTEFIPIDMREMVKQAIDLTMPRWKKMARAKGIIYDIDMKGNEEIAPVLGKPSEVREALVNIINNALDAMRNGGRLSFRTWKNDKSVFVSISDTGEGMDEDVQKRIFDPFFSTRSPEGKGLGLSISYGIITRHGGRIDVESKVGKGSTFTIGLPMKMKL